MMEEHDESRKKKTRKHVEDAADDSGSGTNDKTGDGKTAGSLPQNNQDDEDNQVQQGNDEDLGEWAWKSEKKNKKKKTQKGGAQRGHDKKQEDLAKKQNDAR